MYLLKFLRFKNETVEVKLLLSIQTESESTKL